MKLNQKEEGAMDNIDNCVSKVEELGRKVIVKPQDIPDACRICRISDPIGVVICLMQPN